MAKKQKTKKIKLTNSQKKILAKRQLKMRNRLILKQFNRLRLVFKQLRGEIDVNEQMFLSEFAWETFSSQLFNEIKKGILETVSETSNFLVTHRGIDEKLIPAVKNKTLKALSEKVIAEKVTNITKTTKDILNKIIVRGQESGTNIKDIAKEITQKVKGMEKTRAMIIARTETATTSTTTYLEGLIKAGLPKTWRHIGGGKTDRPTHLALDNVTIEDASEPFSNGMMCPHDLNADVSELIRCHCELI
jgi:phage protein F-like protein|nr:MAG TPA: minor head component F [Caudoviricetes sp.]